MDVRELLNKHLGLLGEKPIRYNRRIYKAFLNSLEEVVTCYSEDNNAHVNKIDTAMTNTEIIEKQQALAKNDILHYNKRIDEIENEIAVLNKKKNLLQQKIGRKQICINQLEADK